MDFKKILIALIGSFFVFLFELSFTIFFTEFLKLSHFISYALALLSGLFLLFYYHRRFTFKVKNISGQHVLKFFSFYGSLYLFNWLIVSFLSLFFNYIYVIISVSFVLWPVQYLVNSKWVFKKKIEEIKKKTKIFLKFKK
jgi:putative flippase GtrA